MTIDMSYCSDLCLPQCCMHPLPNDDGLGPTTETQQYERCCILICITILVQALCTCPS